MEEKTIGMIITPDGKALTFDECLDNLKHTRDFNLYLDMLNVFKDRYLIILSIKDTSGSNISEESVQKIKNIGFTDYTTESPKMYIGISNNGKVIFNHASDDQATPIYFKGMVENVKLFVSSKSSYCGNTAEIIINDEDCSLNERGLNFVVYDCEKTEVVDASSYDAHLGTPPFFHRDLYFSDQYIDSHIYMPKKHMGHIAQILKKSYFSNRKLSVREVERGIFLPNRRIKGKTCGGVCNEKFNFIAGHQDLLPDNGPHRHISGSYSVKPEDIDYIDETVVYGGTMTNHPGHLIIECFADRIWWFVKNADSNLKIAVTSIWDTLLTKTSKYTNFVEEFLNAFGIPKERIIYIKKATQFKKIIIPDQSAIPFHQVHPYDFTSGYIQVFKHITNQISPAKYKKIYLTKKQTDKKNVMGEDYFIDFYKKRGFEIISPEDYTIKEKAELLYGADEVATLDGTNSLFAVFCKPSVKFTVLARQGYYDNPSQPLTNAVAGIKEYYYVNVSGNFINRHFFNGLLLICVTDEFVKYVKRYFNEDLDITPKESLKNCLYDYLAYFPTFYSSDFEFFDSIKNIKALEIMQSISEIFLDKDFDTSKLDLSTNESNLQNQVKDLTAQKSTLTTEVSTLSEENKTLKSAKTQNETEIAQLRTIQNKLNAELLDAHRQKDEADKKFVELYQQKDEVYQKLLEAYRQKDETEKKLLAVTEEKTVLVADISIKKHQLDTLLSEKDKLTANVAAKESELLVSADKVRSLESKLAAANKKVQSIESELETANSKAHSLESELATANNKIQSFESELAIEGSNVQSLKSDLAVANKKVQSIESELETANSKTHSLGSELATANNKIQSFESELAIEGSKVRSLKSDLAVAIKNVQLLEQECAELKNKIDELEKSRSWRITKPLRSIMWFFRRLFGKTEK